LREFALKTAYLETISLIERLHRQCLEVVKSELDRIGVRDLNNVQALILFNIGEEELTRRGRADRWRAYPARLLSGL
jgi:hypothetical protein